jgi:hypothetical protein
MTPIRSNINDVRKATQGPTGDRGIRAALVRRRLDMDDAGMTLVELLIASTLLIVLLTAVMLTMNMLQSVDTSVGAQYQEYDQTLPAFAPLQTLLRAEIEPGPAQNGIPTPGFGVPGQPTTVGNFSLTFFANIGTAYNNVTSAGTTGGPAKIVAQELDSNGAPVTSATHCDTTNLCSFTVTEYLPIVSTGSCPQGQPYGTVCSTCPLTPPSGTSCQYPTTGKLVVDVLGVTNDPSQPGNGAAPTQPIFTYNVFDPVAGVGTTLTTATVQSGLTCTGATAATCPADFIQSVGIELMVSRKGAGTNGTMDASTIIYRYAKSAGATNYPFQYSITAG